MTVIHDDAAQHGARPQDPIAIAVVGWLGWSNKFLPTMRRWHQRARQRQALLDLNDHLLADVGITRDTAAREAAKPFWT